MTRHRRLYRPVVPAPPLLAAKLQAALVSEANGEAQPTNRQRQRTIACLLSASEGWRQASAELGGAFADGKPTNPWLISDEES